MCSKMAVSCHITTTVLLSFSLATVVFDNFGSQAGLTSRLNDKNKHEQVQYEEILHPIAKPLKIQPSRPWVQREMSDSTKTTTDPVNYSGIVNYSGAGKRNRHDEVNIYEDPHDQYKRLQDNFQSLDNPADFAKPPFRLSESEPNFNYVVKLWLRPLLMNTTNRKDVLNDITRIISHIYGDADASNIIPLSSQIEEDTLMFMWGNRTLDYPLCSREIIDRLSEFLFAKDRTIKPNVNRAFRPNFKVERLEEERSGYCIYVNEVQLQIKLMEQILLNDRSFKQRHRVRRNTMDGSSPKVNATLGTLNASYCALFYVPIPENIFWDKEDGNTRNLSLSLHFDNGTLVNHESWLQLDKNLQTLYGYIKVSDDALANAEKLFNYKLRATDSSGLTSDAPFSVKIPDKPPDIYFRIDLVVNTFENQGRPDVNEAMFLAYKVFSFFQDTSFSNINILSFYKNHSKGHTEDKITFGWTNCSVTGNECPVELVNALISKIIMPDGSPNPSFATSLQPQYVIHNLRARKEGVCQEISTSFVVTPTPVDSLWPVIRTAIPELSVSTTVYFSYQIAMNTFYDSLDGYTRSLSLELGTAENVSLTTTSWLQFDTSSQTMYGILTSNLFGQSYTIDFRYILLARNSRGYSSQMSITMKGFRQAISFGALFLIQGRDNSLTSTNDVTILSSMLQKLRSYLKDTSNVTIEVNSFDRTVKGQQKIFSFAYYNTTITTGNCMGLNQLIPLLRKEGTLINEDLTIALVPEVVADRIDITRYGNCSVFVNRTILPSPTPGGLFPVVQNRVPVINIKTGVFFQYRIPTDSFYDATDGNTAKLTLEVTEINGDALNRSSWIQFDASNQNIYGLLASSQQSIKPFQNFTFLLRARNSLGYTAIQVIKIQSEYVNLDVGVIVTFNGRDYSSSQWNSVQLQNFMLAQLRNYFGVTSNDTIQMISFQQQATGTSQFTALWTDSRLTSTGCDQTLLRQLESKIFSAKDTIHPNLISKMLPNIVLIDAKITYYGQCLRNISSNAPNYTNTLPMITAKTGFPFTYQIPRNTFTDNIDGDTRSLLLTLTNIDGSAINGTSRVQFNTSSQILSGIFFDEFLKGIFSKTFYYTLTASNSRNFKTQVSLSIRVTLDQIVRGIVVRTSANTFYIGQPNILQLTIDFLRSLSKYIQPSVITDFSIISLQQTSINVQQSKITWSYSKINGVTCNKTNLNQFLALLNSDDGQVNPNFVTAMSPTFLLIASTTQTVNDCNKTFSSINVQTPTISITPTRSILLHSSELSSSIGTNNNPPTVTSKILPLFAYFCIPFSYSIPSDLFYDQEQGGTRNLQIHLETHAREPVGTTSWLQYSKSSQVLYGILKIDDFYKKPAGGYRYYLIATDNQGQRAATDFTITIPESPVRYNHVISLTFDRVFDSSVPDVNEQLLISTKILEYFGDANSNNINLISYKNLPGGKTAEYSWSNCSLPYTPCPTADLSIILSKISDNNGKITEDFKNAMLTQYTIYSLKVEKLHPCNISDQSSTIATSSLIYPTPSIPPNLPPILQNPLDQINITWCAPLQYQLPSDMFYDAKDGSTRNLSLELTHVNGKPLSVNYWLKFDKNTQFIYAYPTLNDLKEYEAKQFLISARNTRNLNASQVISVSINRPKPNPNHQLQVTASAYVTTQISDVDIRILIYNKMRTYFQSNQSDVMSFANYTKSKQSPSYLLFTFSNCSLSENACDRSELDSMLAKIFSAPGIINSDFIVAFSPEIVVTDIRVESLGLCSSVVPTQSWIQSTAYDAISASVTAAPKNQKPLVLQTIGVLDVVACSVFTFTVPDRLFYDIEDGLTRNLKLAVTTLNGLALTNDSWLMFDSKTQTLKGVMTIEDANELQYILTATDKGGLSVSQTLQFRVVGGANPLIFIVNSSVTSHFPPGTSRIQTLEYFMTKLVSYLSASQQLSVQIISFQQTLENQMNISWTICNIKDACNTTFLTEIQMKLVIQENIVNPDLVIALAPSIIINRLQIQNIHQCSSTAVLSTMPPHQTQISASLASSIEAHSSSVVLNNPPTFTTDIPTLQASPCSPFSFQLPSNLCYDPEDGFNGTKIGIAYRNGSGLSLTSLLQFNNVNKTIYGIIKESDVNLNGQLNSQFVIYCEDTKNLRASRNLDINVTDTSSSNDNGYSLTIQAYLYPVSTLTNVDIQLLWISKFRSYLQHPSGNSVLFLQFKRWSSIQAEFSFRLCSLDVCNYTALNFVRDKIFSTIPNLNPQFIAAMIPEFSLVSTSFQAPSVNLCPILSTSPISTLLQSSSIPPVYNTPVKVLRSIPDINITLCSRFEYAIPFDTFYDLEDGYTSNLTVKLHYENNTVVDANSWVQYDNASLMITGYIFHDVASTSDIFQYKLIAQDTRGSIASIPVHLRLTSGYKTINHYYSTEADLYGIFKNNIDIMTEIANRIKNYYGKAFDKGVFFGNFVKYNYQQPKLVFTWGSCALLESCDQTSLKAVTDRLLFSGTIINFEFIAALAPNIIIKKITQASSLNCTATSTSTVLSFTTPDVLTTPTMASTIILQPTTTHLPALSTEIISPSTAYIAASSSSTIPATPVIRNALNPIITTICSLLIIQIPENTFYDANDGYTRNLNVTARLQNETSIPEDFWLSFDSHSQTFNGQPTIEALKSQHSDGYQFIIRATNRANYFVETPLTIRISEIYPTINHNITVSFEEIGTSSRSNFDAISVIRNKIASYFGDATANNIGILRYNRNIKMPTLTNVTWYNCSMGNQTCDARSMNSYFSRMVDSSGKLMMDFSSTFLPNFRLKHVVTSLSDSCHGITSSLRSTPDIVYTITEPPFIQSIASTLASTGMHAVNTITLSSVIRIDNGPPVALKSINVSLSSCDSLRFKLPNDVFYDKEDGGTGSLEISLSSLRGRPIDCNSTLRLNQTTNEVYGGVVLSTWRSPKRYLLTAKDKEGLTATTTMTLSMPDHPEYATFTVTFKIKLSGDKCIADTLGYVHNALKSHLPFLNTSILHYSLDQKSNSLVVTWTDCALLDAPCNLNRNSLITQRIIQNNTINERLFALMLPAAELQSVSTFTTEICSSKPQLYMNITFCNRLSHVLNDSSFNSTLYNIQTQEDDPITFKLTATNGNVLPWAIFDAKTKSIRVMPVYNALKNRPTTQLLLNATYKGKLIKSQEITLFHPESTAIQINYTISMKITSYKSTSVSDVELLDTIVQRLSSFEDSWLIIDYNRTTIYPETVHVSLSPCFTVSECNKSREDSLAAQLTLGNGIPSNNAVRALSPDLVLLELDVTSKGTCSRSLANKTASYINITVALCTQLYSPVADNTITGGINKSSELTYELLNSNKEAVGLQSWVQFNSQSRVFYGVPTQKDLIDQPESGYLFFLRVRDKDERVIDVQVNITIVGNKTKPSYSQTIFYQSAPQGTQSIADILLDFRTKIAKFLGNVSTESIGLISFQRSFDLSKIIKIEFTNCSLLRSPGTCDNYSTSFLSQKTLSSNGQPSSGLIMALGENYTAIKIIETRTDPCENTSNTLPLINSPLPILNASMCSRLEFLIPNDTFVDREDGDASSLVLLLKTANMTSLSKTSWIQLDMQSKVIYGIPTYDVLKHEPVKGYSYLLQAWDSRSGLASLPVTIALSENITARSLVNVFMQTSFSELTTSVEIQRVFLQKTESCLNISMQSVAIAYFKQTEGARKYVNVSIFHNCSSFVSSCDEKQVNNFLDLFVTNSTVKQIYKTCMAPEFSINQVQVSLSKLCKNGTKNNPPSTKGFLPMLNLKFCEVLYYKIPNDTFTDAEDGTKILDTAELTTRTGEPVKASDFVQFDKRNRTIYALYPQNININITLFEYYLQVTDTGGEIARTKVVIKPMPIARNFTYKVCLSLRKYSRTAQSNIDIVIDILKKIEIFLTDSSKSEGILTAINYSVTSKYPQTIDLCFSNCSFINDSCNKGSVDAIRRKLFLRDDVLTLQFRQSLNPDFIILKATDSYVEYCAINSMSTTSMPATTAFITSTATATPIHHCLSGQNTAPKVLNSVGTLIAYVGQPTSYNIKRDVIYDKEDGYLRIASLTDMNGNEVQEKWIQYDEVSQRVYLSVDESEERGEKSFRIVAKDSCGASVYDVLKINVIGSVSCCYTIQLRSYKSYAEFNTNATFQYQFYKRLTQIYNDTSESLRLYAVTNSTGNYTAISYTNSSFTNESCYYEETRRLYNEAFYKNGTAREEFLRKLVDYQVFDAAVNNNSHCNGTVIIIPPVIVPPPGNTSALTFNDWLWYILPFIILAFLIICCCFLFYWCKACRETCCGAKKADGLFTAAAAQPIQEEIMPRSGEAYQAEDPNTAAQAAAAAAARPQDNDIDSNFEGIYADIGTTKDSSVPSLHKNRQMPVWMRQAANGSSPQSSAAAAAPVPAVEEPLIAGVAAMPQEAPVDSTDAPVVSNVASRPRRRASEVPLTASHLDNVHRRPSYLITPSTSAFSFEEDPLTQSVAPFAQAGQPLPERPTVEEDLINPIDRQNMEAAPSVNQHMGPVVAPVNEGPVEAAQQPLFQGPNDSLGPVLRLPSTPFLAPGEPPPPYSPPKLRKVVSNQVITEAKPKRSVFVPRGVPKVRLKHPRRPTYAVERHELTPLSRARFSSVSRSKERPLNYPIPKEKIIRPSVIRRTLSGPRRRRVDPIYSSHTKKEPVIIHRSPKVVKRHRRSPSIEVRKSPTLSNYFTDSDTDVTSLEEYSKPEMPRYGSRELLEVSGDGSETVTEKHVPVEINGVVNAPESVLMKWMKDGSLKTTITNASPTFEKRRTPKDQTKYKIRSPKPAKKREKTKQRRALPRYDRESIRIREKQAASPSRSRRSLKHEYLESPEIYIEDGGTLSEDVLSLGKVSERTLKRGYPYSQDPYEYVETAMKPRQSTRMSHERISRMTSPESRRLEPQIGVRAYEKVPGRSLGRSKSRRSIGEILARMSRRKELKRNREAFEDEEFYAL